MAVNTTLIDNMINFAIGIEAFGMGLVSGTLEYIYGNIAILGPIALVIVLLFGLSKAKGGNNKGVFDQIFGAFGRK